MTGVEDLVVAELRSQKIKLWEAPYVNTVDQTSPNRASLDTLADQLVTRLPSSLSKDDIVTALLSLQEHALNKKKAKQAAAVASSTVVCNLEVKVVGLRHDIPNEPTQATWADRVEIKPKALVLHGLSPQLTVATFEDELKTLLEVSSSSLRLVHRGKSISDDERLPLVQVLSQHCKSHKTTLLCIVSPTVDTTAPQQQQDSSQSQPSPTRSLIRSIRDAATKLASNTFEVTDQHGNHVSMLPQERLAFLTALGLHAIGKQRLTTNWSDALVFLLEADHEWNGVAQQWRDRVDNYGLLQLDICWLYLKLESLESLEDVVKRLDLAERVLRKQVHTNFVTLALVQADMGNPVPPLSAVFCRLFLLQGIAYHFGKAPSNKSKERLEWAYALCSSLRSVSTTESVTSLQGAMPNLTQEQAISALRRTNGNPNQAAQLIETDKTNAIQHESKRRTQRKLGLCENTKDYVNLDLLEQLQSVLGLPSMDAVAFSLEDVNTQAAGGLLRLTNNDMERAIDLYQEVGRNPNAVLQRLDALDDSLRKQGIESPRRKRSREHEVDQVALATLVSMGVQEPTAKQALEKSQNNVEMALLWLSEGTDTATNGSNQDDMLEEAVDATDGTDGSNQDDMSGEANVDDDDESSDSSGSSHNGSKSSSSHNDARTLQERERDQVLELLQQELGQALQEKDLESEYLGSTLDEEWDFLAKFRSK